MIGEKYLSFSMTTKGSEATKEIDQEQPIMGDVFNQILDGFEEFASITHNERAKSKIDMYRNLFCEDSIKEDKNESINDDFRLNDRVNISCRSTEADTEYLKNGNEPKPKVCQKKAGEYVYPPLSLLIRQEEDVYTDF